MLVLASLILFISITKGRKLSRLKYFYELSFIVKPDRSIFIFIVEGMGGVDVYDNLLDCYQL